MKPDATETLPDRIANQIERLFRSNTIKLASLLIFIFWLRLREPGADYDLFARLAVGRSIDSLGFVPTTDPFSFTPVKPIWIDHEWLAGFIFYKVYSLLGDAGLLLLEVGFVFGTSLLLLASKRIYTGGKNYELPLLLLINLSLYGLWGSTVRSLIFSYFGEALILFALVCYLKRNHALALIMIPVYMLIWANAHAGFVVGLGSLGVLGVINPAFGRRKRLLITGVTTLCCLATLVTPYSPVAFWRFILMAVFKTRHQITEWLPVPLFSKEALWTLPWILPAILQWLRGHKLFDPVPTLFVLGCAVLGFRSYRMLAFFYLTAFVFMSPYIEALLRTGESRFSYWSGRLIRSFSIYWGFCCILFVVYFAKFILNFQNFRLNTDVYPVAAVDWLRQNIKSGSLLIHFDWGSYAIWHLYPQFKVSMDGRYEEVYPESTVKLVSDALTAESKDHAAALNQIDPDYIVLDTVNYTSSAAAWSEFRSIFKDDKFTVLHNATK